MTHKSFRTEASFLSFSIEGRLKYHFELFSCCMLFVCFRNIFHYQLTIRFRCQAWLVVDPQKAYALADIFQAEQALPHEGSQVIVLDILGLVINFAGKM